MRLLEMITLIMKVAFRNLWLYRVKTLVIGTLLCLGTFLGVIGFSLLRDVEGSMRESIIGSIAGHLQIYSDKAKDDLALFGGGFMGRSDIGELPDIVPYREVAMANPNVQAFVPMGLDMSLLGRGNEMDESLDLLREALKNQDPVAIQTRIDAVRFQLEQLKKEAAEQKKLAADVAIIEQREADIAKAEAPGFLDDLKTVDEAKLQFLETKIAPLSGEKTPIYLGYIGTDISIYQKNFSKFHVIEGQDLPPGQRGILLAHRARENFLKVIVARLFDRLNKRLVATNIKIKGDAENERNAADLARQYSAIISSLSRDQASDLSKKLTDFGINGAKPDQDLITHLTSQLKEFLTVNDENFRARHEWFYKNIAPLIKLYEISPGETITLRAYTRSGYVKSLPLKVYGVYSFAGLEDSDLAGQTSIIDLVSFRELYGKMTEASQKELAEMRAQVGIKDIEASNAEDALFGEASQAQIETRSLEAKPGPVEAVINIKPTIPDRFDLDEVTRGLALNAAIKLKDPSRLAQTQEELIQAFKDKGLGVRVVDWQQASGIVGQMVNIMRLVLVLALGVIGLVTLVIINNSIIVGTLNRIREIGTMRAIGAQKSFVVGLFLGETCVTGLIGSILGAILGAVVLVLLSKVGIPAVNDVVSFLFSGPRLYPNIRWDIIIATPFVITLVATLSSIYAARLAARVQPAEAMQEKE
ncbi:MAG TPA: FtsX-like permease family protein [Oligoflexus sp.]|uniref:ABC transporter permease n=1 Tax=Oligoflexus sp. TaxID=1971216 RepID=UPI002D80DB5B|nr:FtsX-like permease family protein [Oligoflexus sp.]HET9240430.1 FtsX-like permease family protein [Oligoflexus sp.]